MKSDIEGVSSYHQVLGIHVKNGDRIIYARGVILVDVNALG